MTLMQGRYLILAVLFAILLCSCATPNTVRVIKDENSVIKAEEDPEGELRYSNLYPREKTYPTTCEQDCYPKSPLVACQSEAENCRFVGDNPKVTSLIANEAGFNLRWLGHASFYLETGDGSSFLFDPVREQFDWPVNWANSLTGGITRNLPDWPTVHELNKLDAVMYSHIHYDHFNKSDIDTIGNQPEYLTPLGFAGHFEEGGYQISEMAWFSQSKVGEVAISFVPANHFSSRIWVPYLYEDNDKSLWGGWLLEYQGKKLLFAGDTGYSEHFKEIHRRYGDIDICLMPIASYYHAEYSNWYRYVHTTPEDALIAAAELNCKVMLPFGYGNATWKMGDHSSHSALLRLLHMHKVLDSKVPLYILNEGEQVAF